MSTSSATNARHAVEHAPASAADSLADRIRVWLLAGFAAVCVARPLVPSEGVAWLGDGHAFTMLLLILTGGCLLLAWYEGRFARRFHLTDAGVAALVFFCVSSALVGVSLFLFGSVGNPEFRARLPAPRLGLNMIWEWVGLGLTYFLARQLPKSALQIRTLVAIMIALATALAVLGIYQVAVTLPAERAAYEADPDQVLNELGQWYPPGSPERTRFEARLGSTEPLATFALTNSLAGILIAWIVVHAGVIWQMVRARRGVPLDGLALARLGGALAALGLMIFCLALTKSRSAYVALAIGAITLPLALASISKSAWRWLGAGFAGAAVVAIALLASGIVQPLVDDAARSFQFRIEYWQATLDLIANFPVMGVGPGEFQDYYTMYKLPQASEEVRDPHNFILEVWATGGTFALVGLVAMLSGFGMAWYESRGDAPRDLTDRKSSQDKPWLPLAGALAGLPVAYAVGLPFGFLFSLDQAVIAAGAGAFLVFAVWPWLTSGSLPRNLTAVAALVLMIHWLASGGFTFPGVAGSFWILVALTVNQAAKAPADQVAVQQGILASRPRWWAAGAITFTLFGVMMCYWTGLLPVLALRAALARAANQQLSPNTRFSLLVQAGAADWASAEPFMALAELCAEQSQLNPTEPQWPQNMVRATRGVLLMHGHSSANTRRLAHLYSDVFVATRSSGAADRCVDMARVAVLFYPNSAQLQAEYALALDTVSNKKSAQRVAEKALELDKLTPHADKKLTDNLRRLMREIVEDDDDA